MIERGGLMIRGTTAGFKFTLPYPLSKLAVVKVTFWQEGYKGITKEFKDFSESDNSTQLTVTLSASDTKTFTDRLKARVQLVADTRPIVNSATGEEIEPSVRFASRITLITVHPMKDGIIDKDPEDTAPIDENGRIILDGQEIFK